MGQTTQARAPAGQLRRARTVRVRVKGGFEPDTIVGRAGDPLRIVFRREETASCSERVVFPELGRSATLPLFEDVSVDLTPQLPGQYAFTCELGVLRGRLVVIPGDENDGEGRL